MEIKKLERSSTLQVLVFMSQKGKQKTNVSEIYRNVKASPETISMAIKFLAEFGLVQDEELKAFPPQRVVCLTEKGLRIAQSLSAVESELKS